MSQHAHIRVRLRTVRSLGARPQEFFVLTTDEHRWTQIFRGVGKLYPLRRGGNHSAWPFVGRPKAFFICVNLCESVVKKFPAACPPKALNFVHQNLRKPQQNPTSSSLVKPEFFCRPPGPPAPPILDPQSSIYGLPLPSLCASVPPWLDIPAFSRAFLLPASCLRAFVPSCLRVRYLAVDRFLQIRVELCLISPPKNPQNPPVPYFSTRSTSTEAQT